jgi:tRNA(fMet)-specific endonuclease VapC
MPRFMFDTNIISYTMKHPTTALAERYRFTPTSDVLVSSVVEAELRYGAARLPKEAKLHRLVEAALSSLTIASWDSNCAKAHASLRTRLQKMGRSMTYADAMIGAHAIALNLVLVTNDSVFQDVPGLHAEFWAIEPGHAYR